MSSLLMLTLLLAGGVGGGGSTGSGSALAPSVAILVDGDLFVSYYATQTGADWLLVPDPQANPAAGVARVRTVWETPLGQRATVFVLRQEGEDYRTLESKFHAVVGRLTRDGWQLLSSPSPDTRPQSISSTYTKTLPDGKKRVRTIKTERRAGESVKNWFGRHDEAEQFLEDDGWTVVEEIIEDE
jgi:hypothetical protein